MLEYALYMQTGLGASSVALSANQLALGSFFSISGFHKLFVKARHLAILETMKSLRIPLPTFNARFVPTIELAGGLALISGLLAPLAAVGLFIICLVAVCTDGLGRVVSYAPIDKADYLDDLLYLPEVLYLLGLAIIIFSGPGYSILGVL